MDNENIVFKYAKKIFGFAYAKTHNSYEAEDLSQEILLQILNKQMDFSGVENMDAYVYRICCYTWSNYLRKNKTAWNMIKCSEEVISSVPSDENTVEDESERDGYWTNVGYFNSIRELGQTETWIKADIDEYLHVIYKRRYEDKEEGYAQKRRYIYEDEELTSRISSDKIPFSLQKLGYEYPAVAKDKRPVDICLATNMISVGVDVPRLGLMTVSGQPKTTSEYIQATSRVGRNSKAPGLVFTIYNPGKPRDRSHYEHFETYHSRVYCNVEPTSVTPFSAQLRERALHAIVFGLLRLKGDSDLNADPPKPPSFDDINEIKEIIAKRIEAIDSDELEKTLDHIDYIIDKWKVQEPGKYQDFTAGEVLPLMFPAGSMRNASWGNRGFPTPTSMRNVDASCEAMVLESGYFEEDE